MRRGDVLVSRVGMEQYKDDPCVFQLIKDNVVVMIIEGVPEACDFLIKCILGELQTTGEELSWYLGYTFERDWK